MFRQIQAYLDSRVIQGHYVSGIFSLIRKVRHTRADSGIHNLGTVRHILVYQAYSEPMVCSAIFRTIDTFSQFQARYSGITQVWTLSRQIQVYLAYLGKLWLIQARNVSRIFRHIHKFTYLVASIEEYLPTFGYISLNSGIFRIPCIAVPNSGNQCLLFKSGSSFKLFKSI